MSSPLKPPVVVVGLGQLGGFLGRGFLRRGHPVWPLLKGFDLSAAAAKSPQPELVLLAVGVQDLDPLLAEIPDPWRDRLVLVNNELIPAHWESHGLPQPTVAPIWFEVRQDCLVRVNQPTPVYGPRADLLLGCLEGLGVPARRLESLEGLKVEMALKNLYILTMNIMGVAAPGTAGELLGEGRDLAEEVAEEVLDLQEGLMQADLPRDRLLERLWEALAVSPQQGLRGRTSRQRLQRALDQAHSLGLSVPTLEGIQRGSEGDSPQSTSRG